MLSLQTVRQFVKSHPRRAAVIGAAALAYALLNVWVYRYATSRGASSPMAAIQSFFTKKLPDAIKSGGFPDSSAPIRVDTGKSIAPAAGEAKRKATPTPTPRPTGPGVYACSPEGVCNLYSDEMRRQYCAKTYADPLCLDQCADRANQCSK